jgi:hypothetical protein
MLLGAMIAGAMQTRWFGMGLLALGFGLACTGTAEVPTETPEVQPPAPEPAPAAEPAGKAKRGKGKGKIGKVAPGECPEGIVAAPSWPGEYPGPVVDVVKPVKVAAFGAPCGKPLLDCEVPKGLYHPWSELEAEYVTVRALERYKAKTACTIEGTSVAVGDIVEVYQYFGEGYCGYRVAGKELADACPDLLEGTPLEQIPGPEVADRQMFSVKCGAKTGWVEASQALFDLPEVREGTIVEYGVVGPGKD